MAKKKYTVATFSQKCEIIEYKKKNKTTKAQQIADIFSAKFKIELNRRTVSNILQKSETILQSAENHREIAKKVTKLVYPELEERLKNYLDFMESKGAILDDKILLIKAKQFSDNLSLVNFRCSMGRLQKFKQRHSFQLRNLHGETQEVAGFNQNLFFSEIKEKISEYGLECIYNMDETGIFYKIIPSKTICLTIRPGYKNFK